MPIQREVVSRSASRTAVSGVDLQACSGHYERCHQFLRDEYLRLSLLSGRVAHMATAHALDEGCRPIIEE